MADLCCRSLAPAKRMPIRDFMKEPLNNGDSFAGHAQHELELNAALGNVNGLRFFPPNFRPGTFAPVDPTDFAVAEIYAFLCLKQ